MADNEIYLNEEETVSVTIWENGDVTTATRETSDDVWGPPVPVYKTLHGIEATLKHFREYKAK